MAARGRHLRVGDELEGKVTKVVTFGAFVEILDGVEGLVHISELAQHHVENPREIVEPGQDVRVKILEIDSERRRLRLSVKRVRPSSCRIKSAAEAARRGAERVEELGEVPDLGLSDDVFAGPERERRSTTSAPPWPTSSEPRRARGRAAGSRTPRRRGAPPPRPPARGRSPARARAARRSRRRPPGEAADEPAPEPDEATPPAESARAGCPKKPPSSARSEPWGSRSSASPAAWARASPRRCACWASWAPPPSRPTPWSTSCWPRPSSATSCPRGSATEVAPERARSTARPIAERVFGDDEARAWLEGELWPRVGARMAAWRAGLEAADPAPPAAVVEVPLLFESGMEAVFDKTIAVVADEAVREERAGGRGHAAVAERAGRQLSQEEKAESGLHGAKPRQPG